MKLLLHICCAPCSAACIKVLREEKDIDIKGYWYNPNIHPYKEYENRLNALKEYSKMINLEEAKPEINALIVSIEKYKPSAFAR
jgi:predicted adenine nucleotide alpha hydrolase (AANH) superfamily ATPase